MPRISCLLLLLLTACATITAESEQEISVRTTPEGAACNLRNKEGLWTLDRTPGTAVVKRSFSPLTITCAHEGEGPPMTATLDPKTRGRAYGNILLGGFPAYVDASTGAGYEYAPSEVELRYPTE